MNEPAYLWPSLTLAFALELCGLAAYGWWGVKVGTSGLSRAALGVGAPLVAAGLWGLFAAPRAPVSSPAVAVVVQVGFFLGAALVLSAGGHAQLACVLLVVVLVNTAVLHVPGRDHQPEDDQTVVSTAGRDPLTYGVAQLR